MSSEGRGHRFESCRARHIFNDLAALASCLIILGKQRVSTPEELTLYSWFACYLSWLTRLDWTRVDTPHVGSFLLAERFAISHVVTREGAARLTMTSRPTHPPKTSLIAWQKTRPLPIDRAAARMRAAARDRK